MWTDGKIKAGKEGKIGRKICMKIGWQVDALSGSNLNGAH